MVSRNLTSAAVQHCLETSLVKLEQSFHKDDIKVGTTYAAAIIMYNNIQRPGVVQNLTVHEFESRQQIGSNKAIIACLNHKTVPQGRAQLVANSDDEGILMKYH